MIKIEQLLDGATATIVRQGDTIPVFVGMIIEADEIATIVVTKGTLVYTVDELEVVEVKAAAPVVPAKPAA